MCECNIPLQPPKQGVCLWRRVVNLRHLGWRQCSTTNRCLVSPHAKARGITTNSQLLPSEAKIAWTRTNSTDPNILYGPSYTRATLLTVHTPKTYLQRTSLDCCYVSSLHPVRLAQMTESNRGPFVSISRKGYWQRSTSTNDSYRSTGPRKYRPTARVHRSRRQLCPLLLLPMTTSSLPLSA